MTEPLFRDPAVQSRLDEDGFVLLPLLEQPQIDDLLRFYRSVDRGDVESPPFHYSMDHPDSSYVEGVMEEVAGVLGEALDPHVVDTQIFTASYVVKESNPRGVVPPHQDWSFVDESRYPSTTVWTPLVDVDAENGALGVIHGSHRFFPGHIRASPSPQCRSVLSDHLFTLFPFVDIQPMRAGQALVFNNSLIHASPPNTSGAPRVAAAVGITHRDADIRHHYLVPGSEPPEIEVYEADRDFFVRYGNDALSKLFAAGERPQGRVIDRRPYRFDDVSREEMLALVARDPRNQYKEELVETMKALFGQQ